MTDSAQLGGGYAESNPDPHPTVAAVLAAASSGCASARLLILAGPPGVGKSTAATSILGYLPHAIVVEKDLIASGFVLQAARDRNEPTSGAYGSKHYWQTIRPLEYAGATGLACANLVGTRTVLLVGGWGPELAVCRLWTELTTIVAPARLSVVHLEAPPSETWRQRLSARGSRADSPWFETFAAAVSGQPVWPLAHRIPTDQAPAAVVGQILAALD